MSKEQLTGIAEGYLSTLVQADVEAMIRLIGANSIIEDPRFPGNKGETQITKFVTDFQSWDCRYVAKNRALANDGH